MRMIVAAVVAIALPIAACGTAGTGPAAEAIVAAHLPANYREQIVAMAKTKFFDPYSIRDAGISQPMTDVTIRGQVAKVCIQANAKNRMGGYVGLKPTVIIFYDGKIDASDSDYAALSCTGAIYQPFPELEAGATTSRR